MIAGKINSVSVVLALMKKINVPVVPLELIKNMKIFMHLHLNVSIKPPMDIFSKMDIINNVILPVKLVINRPNQIQSKIAYLVEMVIFYFKKIVTHIVLHLINN